MGCALGAGRRPWDRAVKVPVPFHLRVRSERSFILVVASMRPVGATCELRAHREFFLRNCEFF